MQRKRGKQKSINDKKKRAIEAAQRAFDEAAKAAEDEADQEIVAADTASESKLAAMQRDFECLPLLRQVYHEAPDDAFELIVSECCNLDDNGWGRVGLNAFRLANKRLKQVVESCTTRLTNQQKEDGPDSLPIPIIQRCKRIKEIRYPSPLASCTIMENFRIIDSSITDISVVASMPLLKVFVCQRDLGRPSIKDLSPLSSCPRLKKLFLFGNRELKDISPLSACSALEVLEISYCPLITSLAPLSNLQNLKELYCYDIDPETSLLPLASCTGLKKLNCNEDVASVSDDELE